MMSGYDETRLRTRVAEMETLLATIHTYCKHNYTAPWLVVEIERVCPELGVNKLPPVGQDRL